MTKPIVSTAVMMLWEEGRFDITVMTLLRSIYLR